MTHIYVSPAMDMGRSSYLVDRYLSPQIYQKMSPQFAKKKLQVLPVICFEYCNQYS